MKKKVIIILIILFVLMLIPIPTKIKNGNTEYKAVLYKVTNVHSPNENSSAGYDEGLIVEILGIQVYNDVSTEVNVTAIPKIVLVKKDVMDTNKFDKYLERDGRVIYTSSVIEEIYYRDSVEMTLKDYISKTYQSLDDSIKSITSFMDKNAVLKDGGTTIYKYMRYDLTVVTCNTVSGNRNIYFGDYLMEYSDSMCK